MVFGKLTSLHVIYYDVECEQSRPGGHHLNVERAWEQNITGRGAVVSILDDGIEYTHPDFKNSYVRMCA